MPLYSWMINSEKSLAGKAVYALFHTILEALLVKGNRLLWWCTTALCSRPHLFFLLCHLRWIRKHFHATVYLVVVSITTLVLHIQRNSFSREDGSNEVFLCSSMKEKGSSL